MRNYSVNWRPTSLSLSSRQPTTWLRPSLPRILSLLFIRPTRRRYWGCLTFGTSRASPRAHGAGVSRTRFQIRHTIDQLNNSRLNRFNPNVPKYQVMCSLPHPPTPTHPLRPLPHLHLTPTPPPPTSPPLIPHPIPNPTPYPTPPHCRPRLPTLFRAVASISPRVSGSGYDVMSGVASITRCLRQTKSAASRLQAAESTSECVRVVRPPLRGAH